MYDSDKVIIWGRMSTVCRSCSSNHFPLPCSVTAQLVVCIPQCHSSDAVAKYHGNNVILKGKGKGFPYSLPSVGPGADLGVQAVSPQVTWSHPPGGRLPLLSARPAVTFPAHRLVPSYTAWWQAHACEQLAQGGCAEIRTRDLLDRERTLYR